ncbi:MAG TPA: hypothetical protein VEK08_11365 [Planctomycetota bacterium]|nr:hypothetical protein [Planctomycetota bacterium]
METNENQKLPRWQTISGLGGEREEKMTADERDAAVRTLLAEVDRLAEIEFARGRNAPAGERSIFWDPLESICRQLGISRTKLSAYSRELTGLRAHERTDRIKARELKSTLPLRTKRMLEPLLDSLRKRIDRKRAHDRLLRLSCLKRLLKSLKIERSGCARARFAAELGFPNASRLGRACLLAHGMAIEELEEQLVCDMVQKFFEELAGAKPVSEKAGPPASATSEPKSGADLLIDEATKEVARKIRAA